MTHYPEYTLILPPICPTNRDHLTHHHAYSDDGWIVECDIEHEIPPEVGQLGVRMALAWAVDHCPRIRAAIDAERRRN
jgi:hypothetical protein